VLESSMPAKKSLRSSATGAKGQQRRFFTLHES
jgi:hypothetical protein